MSAFDEIAELAPKLSPRKFASRLAYWRRADLPAGGLSERVGGSRGHKLPAFDRTDVQINQAEQDYKRAVDGFLSEMSVGDHVAALRQLRKAETLERVWLIPIDKLDAEQLKALDGMISDAAQCMCSNTRELWERMGRRTPWRIKRGLGPCCYSSWAAVGMPDIGVWLKLNRATEAAAS